MATNLLMNRHTYAAIDLSMDGYFLFMDRQILSMNTIIYQLVIQSINWNYLVPVHVL